MNIEERNETVPVLPDPHEDAAMVAEMPDNPQPGAGSPEEEVPGGEDNKEYPDAFLEQVPAAAETGTNGIQERLIAIEEELRRSNELLHTRFLYDAAKEEMITRLHKELQEYKDDLYKKILKPVIMDLIVFADNMRSLAARYEETPDPGVIQERYRKLRSEFLKIGSHIEDLVYNYGVEPFSARPGETFNPKTQQARKNTITADPQEHKKILSSLSPGYTWDEQLLRRESVLVSVCEKQIENNNQ